MFTDHRVHVKKYGGTSVGSVERIQKVAGDLVRAHRAGQRQLVVVSAMAQQTDRLVELARQISPDPPPREFDMLLATGEQVAMALLAMAIEAQGVEAVSLTGAQCGIITDQNYSQARIRDIATYKIFDKVEEGKIVIVAGFQGVTPAQEITTLGRGGSDTTATALAAALGAPLCEIFTDVDGVYTADPRTVPQASLLAYISYTEMLEYAASGSRVLHPRCVEIANKYNVPLKVASSFTDSPGTMIVKEDELERVAVTGVTGQSRLSRVTLIGVEDRPGIAATVFGAIGEAGVNILLIIQSLQHRHTNDISLIVAEEDGPRVEAILEGLSGRVGARKVELDNSVAKISIIGSGIASTPGVAARLFQTLAKRDINIESISTSEVRIACIIARDRLEEAVRAVHEEFQLEGLQRGLKQESLTN